MQQFQKYGVNRLYVNSTTKALKQYRNISSPRSLCAPLCGTLCSLWLIPRFFLPQRSQSTHRGAQRNTFITTAFLLLFLAANSFAQPRTDSLLKKDTIVKKKDVEKKDTVFKHEDIANQGHDTVIHIKDSIYRRALAVFDASRITVTNEAVRAYSSPMTFSALLQETNGGYPLMQTDVGYGRESFEFTNRTSEPLASSFLEGVLPLNDPITGNTDLNYFPLEIAGVVSIENGGMLSGADHASSDVANFSLEKFRAPIPYSRFHYSYPLAGGNELANFEGLFSINPSEPLNIALGVYHRTAGTVSAQGTISAPGDLTFDPYVEQWWVRGQGTYETKKINALLFLLYTSAVSGLNGGIVSGDSTTDIFDPQLGTVRDPSPYDHRTRFDVLAQLGLSLFSENERTLLSAYATTSARQVLGRDSTFPAYAYDLLTAQRYGISLSQPASLQLGDLITRATVRGDGQYLRRSGFGSAVPSITETRLSALGTDSISLSRSFGISLSGYFRETVSNLSVAGLSEPALLLTNFGLEASAKLTEALKVTAQATISKDRASLSPSPTSTYNLRNIGAYVNMNVKFGARERFALAVGYLDRHEPEGVFLQSVDGSDTVVKPVFSSQDIHSSSIRANMDMWFSYFRYSLQATFFPTTVPLSQYIVNPALQSNLTKRIQSATGFYYENEIAEGNLRVSLGIRARYMNTLSPSLTYDPFSDYYIYRGLNARGQAALNDSRLTAATTIFDFIASGTIDQRATVNISLLNLLGTPYYNVAIYPRDGFVFRLDVTWAFLD